MWVGGYLNAFAYKEDCSANMISLSCCPHNNSPTLPTRFGTMTVISKSTTEALGSLTKKLFTL